MHLLYLKPIALLWLRTLISQALNQFIKLTKRRPYMIKLLKISFSIIISTVTFVQAQSIEANWQCTSAIVEYTYVAREFESPQDEENGTHSVSASWPSTAAAAAGYGYTRTLKEYAIGDTITTQLVPLVNEAYLLAAGVSMNVDLNDDGNFTINEGSTYPTTEADNCSTFATVPGVSEAGTWTAGSGFTHPDDPNAYSMGWGISLSSVFAQFSAADLVNGTLGVDYGPGTDMENWGMVTIDYADEAHTVPTDLEIYWEAHDGSASGLGDEDDDGLLDDFLGVPTSPADTVTLVNTENFLAVANPELYERLMWTESGESFSFPILGGTGNVVNADDPGSFYVDPFTGDSLSTGTVMANYGYLFDPAGADGIPFNGDEPLAPTGYFFTANFLFASAIFPGVLDSAMAAGDDLETALSTAAEAVAFIFVDEATSQAIGGSVGPDLYADYAACLGAGGSSEQCAAVFEAGPTMALIGVQIACDYECGVDDSGDDFDYETETGRLVFEVDNVCMPDMTTQRVNTFWTNTALTELDESAPVAGKFELMGNYPNPFNPETKIRFSTERDSQVKVTIYSILGEKVNVIQNSELKAGTYNISWLGKDAQGNKVPSGVYFYEVVSDNRTAKGKMLLLK
jgi:hypothetical protein